MYSFYNFAGEICEYKKPPLSNGSKVFLTHWCGAISIRKFAGSRTFKRWRFRALLAVFVLQGARSEASGYQNFSVEPHGPLRLIVYTDARRG